MISCIICGLEVAEEDIIIDGCCSKKCWIESKEAEQIMKDSFGLLMSFSQTQAQRLKSIIKHPMGVGVLKYAIERFEKTDTLGKCSGCCDHCHDEEVTPQEL
jgi:hypothetical protein